MWITSFRLSVLLVSHRKQKASHRFISPCAIRSRRREAASDATIAQAGIATCEAHAWRIKRSCAPSINSRRGQALTAKTRMPPRLLGKLRLCTGF